MEKINIFSDIAELGQAFTDLLIKESGEKGRVNISLSGGSTPKALFDFWVEHKRNQIPWQKLFFFWGDERCVGPEDEMSNYRMTNVHLFSKVPVPKENIFRVRGEDDPATEAVRYGSELDDQLPHYHDVPRFDIMMLGMGDDGHTASIFPHEIDLWHDKQNCVVASHPESGMKRISVTGKVINNAKNVIFLVTGKAKAEKVRDIIKDGYKFKDTYPAARVDPTAGSLYWFLDAEAAGLLG